MTKVTMAQVNYEQAMDNYYEAQYEGRTEEQEYLNAFNQWWAEEEGEVCGYPYDVTEDDIRAMTREERNTLDNALNTILEGRMCAEWHSAYEVYNTLRAIEDAEYYAKNIDSFREYETHMGEPDFDWDFYSDWHKDMFGFRPR